MVILHKVSVCSVFTMAMCPKNLYSYIALFRKNNRIFAFVFFNHFKGPVKLPGETVHHFNKNIPAFRDSRIFDIISNNVTDCYLKQVLIIMFAKHYPELSCICFNGTTIEGFNNCFIDY